MGFFVTSTGLGDGANLGGLDGADAHCQTLAAAAGAGDRTWRAYLSTQGPGAVNARDRIGEGPWANAHGPRHGHQRRTPALRQLHLQLDPLAGRERQPVRITHRWRPRLHGARRADRHPDRRHGVPGGRGPHLRQLDQQRRRQAPCSATPTATRSRRRVRRGTPPTRHAVAHRRIWWPREGPACSTASPSTDGHSMRERRDGVPWLDPRGAVRARNRTLASAAETDCRSIAAPSNLSPGCR